MEVPGRNGGQFSTCVIGPGDAFNLVGMVGDKKYHSSAFNDSHRMVAVTDLVFAIIPIKAARELFGECNEFAKMLFEAAIGRSRVIIESLENAMTLESTDRVTFLLDRLEDTGVDISEVTHDSIAKVLGMNRVTVTRAMAKLIREK